MVLLAALSRPWDVWLWQPALPSWRINSSCEFNAFQSFLLGNWILGLVSSFLHRAMSSGGRMDMIVCISGEWVGVLHEVKSGWVHVA